MGKKSKVARHGHSISPQNPKRPPFNFPLHNPVNATSSREENLSMWLLESVKCIKCEEGGDVVLCNGNDCPLGVHQQCIGISFTFDENGKLYCPHCRYKSRIIRQFELREKLILAEKARCDYLNLNGERGNGAEENNVDGVVGEKCCDKVAENDPSDEVVVLSREVGENDDRGGKKQRIEDLGLKVTESDENLCEKNEDGTMEMEEEDHAQESYKNFTNLKFASEKHKKVFWKPEEVEMLKEGVEKFFIPGKKISWRKVLHFGRDVFHPTRNPSDLRDKWRKMAKKF